ncbi:MAG: class I SAM-dependent RNA methyltransferase [Pseudomonadota bacterium]
MEQGDIRIERLSQRGEGIAGDVRVPFALPGERWRTDPLTLLKPAPERVEAVCPVFGTCGGCAVQHANDSFVARWKEGQIQSALAAHGLSAPMRACATSPPATRRRASLHVRRTRKTVEIGFLQRASHVLVPLTGCPVLCPAIATRLEDLAQLGGFGASRQGLARLDVTATDAGLDVVLVPAKPLSPKALDDTLALARTLDLARLSLGEEVVFLSRPPVLRFDGIDVVPPPGAFLQATPQGEAALRADVAQIVGDATRVVDLFAGCGTFALPLARGAEVLAVEGAQDLLDALDRAWRGAHGLRRVVSLRRDLFRRPLLAAELKGVEVVVIDPPRAGGEAQMRELAASGVSRVASVSCNPVTFARDAKLLVEAGFSLDWVRMVDQFRWSPHVELTASFTR